MQNAGHAYRLKAEVLKDEFHRGGALQRLLLMFASALITQMVQTAACNRHHPVDQQLCRWMLLSLDRLPSNQIRMNEKLIGNMLGLTPDNVTKATNVLQKAGLIFHYDAGEITVLDRRAVEKRSCECYAVVKQESDRLLPLSVEMARRAVAATVRVGRTNGYQTWGSIRMVMWFSGYLPEKTASGTWASKVSRNRWRRLKAMRTVAALRTHCQERACP